MTSVVCLSGHLQSVKSAMQSLQSIGLLVRTPGLEISFSDVATVVIDIH